MRDIEPFLRTITPGQAILVLAVALWLGLPSSSAISDLARALNRVADAIRDHSDSPSSPLQEPNQ